MFPVSFEVFNKEPFVSSAAVIEHAISCGPTDAVIYAVGGWLTGPQSGVQTSTIQMFVQFN